MVERISESPNDKTSANHMSENAVSAREAKS
jgi:hypothetical protein